MSLRLRNSWKYTGKDRWDWTVYLEDDGSGDLEKVESVMYVLHPSFPNPRVIKTNKEKKFALSTNGWGVFMIRGFASLKNGDKVKLEHYLELQYEPKEGLSD